MRLFLPSYALENPLGPLYKCHTSDTFCDVQLLSQAERNKSVVQRDFLLFLLQSCWHLFTKLLHAWRLGNSMKDVFLPVIENRKWTNTVQLLSFKWKVLFLSTEAV